MKLNEITGILDTAVLVTAEGKYLPSNIGAFYFNNEKDWRAFRTKLIMHGGTGQDFDFVSGKTLDGIYLVLITDPGMRHVSTLPNIYAFAPDIETAQAIMHGDEDPAFRNWSYDYHTIKLLPDSYLEKL